MSRDKRATRRYFRNIGVGLCDDGTVSDIFTNSPLRHAATDSNVVAAAASSMEPRQELR